MTDSLPRYENPLDLLLDLVRQQKVPLAELPLAPVTARYLEYMRQAERLDMNLGIEFAHTAAILIQLKSKALLPEDPAIGSREPDLRRELIRQLLTHQEARQVAETLAQKRLVEQTRFSLPPLPGSAVEEPGIPLFSLWDLMQEFRTLAGQDWTPAPLYVPDASGPGVAEMAEWLRARLTAAQPCLLGDLWSEQPALGHQASLFLAALELARTGFVSLDQAAAFEAVQLTKLQ